MITCHELIDVIDDYLDGQLAPADVDALEQHLAVCDACRAYLATYRRARALGAAAARVEMPEEMTARLREFLRERLG
jgi:anti-sigma factor RsiW